MPLWREAAAQAAPSEPQRERAFLVGMEVRTRGRSATKGVVTAQAGAARDAAAMPPGAASKSKPPILEFDADESLAELRALAESAGAQVVGEILQRRDRPDPATLIGAGKLEEIAGAIRQYLHSHAASSTTPAKSVQGTQA